MKAGRNDPCPCGSGRKYKQCCLLREARGHAVAAAEPRNAAVAYYNRGVEHQGRGQLDAAIASYREALALDPSLEVAHGNLGNALSALGRFDEAASCHRRALALRPENVDTRYNLAVNLHSQGLHEDAARHYRDIVARRHDHVQAHYNLGNALRELGRLDEAQASFERVVALRPDVPEAHANLGQLQHARGDLDGAIARYRAALARKPGDAALHNNLGNALDEAGDTAAALTHYAQAIALADTPELRSNLARCLRHAESIAFDPALRLLLARAIDEAWTRPADLAGVAARAIDTGGDVHALARDPLLHAMLVSAPVCDLALERALVATRRALLDAAAEAGDAMKGESLAFACALARQCSINEYVWTVASDEQVQVSALRDRVMAAIDANAPLPAAWLAAIASYASLAELPARGSLLARDWPDAIRALLTQQIVEPASEQSDRAAIPRLTAIDDAVSVAVRRQYEENPYPRWVRSPPATATSSLNAFLRRQFPTASFAPLTDDAHPDILVAGCGTGQEAIDTAQQFPAARVLAVDLSVASLAYARRKTHEIGVANVEYGQADVLSAATIARTFDVISSVGVLHHLANPAAGLRALLSRLRPGGFMRLGLYSERARGDVVAGRAWIAAQGYRATVDDIRRCRQALAADPALARLTARRDYYTTSECRDLLFHVQEHRFTLPAIAELLADADLRLLGFLLEPRTLRAYRLRFPQDRSATDLDGWNAYEREHPDTFAGMYRFWVQKR